MSAPTTTRLHNLAEAVAKSGLSEHALRILAYLAVAGRCSKDRMAGALGINPSSLPRYLAAIVKSGHLAKAASPEDARAVLFSLSSDGHKLVNSLCLHFE